MLAVFHVNNRKLPLSIVLVSSGVDLTQACFCSLWIVKFPAELDVRLQWNEDCSGSCDRSCGRCCLMFARNQPGKGNASGACTQIVGSNCRHQLWGKDEVTNIRVYGPRCITGIIPVGKCPLIFDLFCLLCDQVQSGMNVLCLIVIEKVLRPGCPQTVWENLQGNVRQCYLYVEYGRWQRLRLSLYCRSSGWLIFVFVLRRRILCRKLPVFLYKPV